METFIKAFEEQGIFITIQFARNLDRSPSWKFIIENVEDQLYESNKFMHKKVCTMEAIKKAIEYIQ